LGITGAMKMAHADAIDVHLGLSILHFQAVVEARAGIYRLCYSEQCKPTSDGYENACMSTGIKEGPILQMGTYKMI
jgi:hypothetical protein